MKQTLCVFFLVMVSAIFYALTLKGVYGNPVPHDIKNNLDQATKPLELSPERGRFALTMSLAEYHSFSLSRELADAVFPDVGYIDGKFYTYFVPGVSLLAVPFYLIGKQYYLAQVATFSIIPIFA